MTEPTSPTVADAALTAARSAYPAARSAYPAARGAHPGDRMYLAAVRERPGPDPIRMSRARKGRPV
ncbi:hypothetical protein [Streptomyces guryensis]|uniref:Uncharacterized protein n=1 Tax=Streptomyces guryensis TaxID=2886947 RepID=A0A9Q3VVF5_9ACTN|nr:hypothetical protein [Streptomyces guryensis]MCD9878887.1 hypothetical protein [Streptomyces guryensis]